jgi:GTP cyclohydrolase I
MKATASENVAVYIQAIHGCCENRGIMAHSSLTQTTVLKGAFNTDPGTIPGVAKNMPMMAQKTASIVTRGFVKTTY